MVKNLPDNAGNLRYKGLIPESGRSLEEGMAATPVFLLGEFHGQNSLVGYSPWGRKELDMTVNQFSTNREVGGWIKEAVCRGSDQVKKIFRKLNQ